MFGSRANTLRPSKVVSLKFPQKVQNFLANTFLSSLFLSPSPFRSKSHLQIYGLDSSPLTFFWFFFPPHLGTVSATYTTYFFVSLLPPSYKHAQKSKEKKQCFSLTLLGLERVNGFQMSLQGSLHPSGYRAHGSEGQQH